VVGGSPRTPAGNAHMPFAVIWIRVRRTTPTARGTTVPQVSGVPSGLFPVCAVKYTTFTRRTAAYRTPAARAKRCSQQDVTREGDRNAVALSPNPP